MTDTPTAAEDFLSRLKSAGVGVLFANGGTDFPSIIEAYANAPDSGLDLPDVHTITHEGVAVGMAHGWYLMTGTPAAVMVHVNVGLANAVMGLINAKSETVPVVMCSGRTPLTESGRFGARSSPIHWGQEMRDQSAMIREVVKWDYELRYPEQAGPIIERAVSIALSEPQGPVYLSLPREVLAESVTVRPQAAPPALPTRYAAADPAAIAAAAAALARAQRPVIIAQSPDHFAGFGPLAALAETHAIPVVDYWSIRQALPSTHPMHAGRDPTPWVKDADVIVALNAMVPWIPELVQPPADCTVIALGPDPLHAAVPARGFPVHISLAGGITPTLLALGAALDAQATDTAQTERRARVAAFRAQAEAGNARRIAAGQGRPMSPAYVSKCLSDAADDQTTFVNELGVDPSVMEFRAPRTLFGSPLSGGLGWGLTAALGMQLAAPDRQVIACIGDGSYIFANPVACHQTAAALGLPLLTVVFNNGLWNAVRRSTLYMYPKGKAAQANVMPITALNAMPDHAAIARAHGAHAERVEDGADLPAAIQRALAATRAGQQALLDVVVSV